MTTVGIVDYGLGNLTSVAGAVRRLGHEPIISSDSGTLIRTDKLILPGVGAFADGMRNLRARGLVEILQRIVMDDGKPILGICLGAQLVARESEEFGQCEGLGWIDAPVRRLNPANPDLRIPHVGWNNLDQVRPSVLFQGVPGDALFYYVHGYCIDTDEEDAIVIGCCEYGARFAAAVQQKNIYATQFHPEKSQRFGLTLLDNFLERA